MIWFIGRVVISVHRLRGHVPQGAVDRVGEALELELPLEILGRERIGERIGRG